MRIFLIDADNFSAPAWVDEALQKLVATEGAFAVRRAYGSAENLKGLSETLKKWAIRPFANLALSKNTTDMAMAVDAMEFACQSPKPTVIAICSGDADFVPLVVRLRERGIKVICLSDLSKLSAEAEPAYDQVVLIGSEKKPTRSKSPATAKKAQAPVVKPVPPQAPKAEAVKATTPKAVPAKKAAAKTPAKKVVPKTEAMSVNKILGTVPALKSGDWQPLGDVAKVLHDEKLLAKSASSTTLFKKFATHFELAPEKQPNKVRYTGGK